MSTIKSSDEHLTLNADGSSKDIKFQANGVEKASLSSAGVMTATNFAANADDLEIRSSTGEKMIKCVKDAQVNLYYDNSKKLATSSTGITVTGGIAIGGTGTANTLDDYEEGTWTPVLNDLSNNATMHALSTGSYTKIGRVVTVTGNVRTSSLGSVSGNLYISGLPYSCAPGNGFHAAGAIANGENFSITAGHSIAIYMSANSSNLRIDIYDTTQGITVMQGSEWSSDGQMAISVTYFAA